MNDRTERMTEPVFTTEPRTTGTPVSVPESAPRNAPDRPLDTAALKTHGDSKGLEPKLTGRGDLGAPPVPHETPDASHGERTGHHEADGAGRPLVPQGARDQLARRMQQAVTDFVESPRRAVEEADSTFDEIVSGLTEALTERRRVLRAGWQGQDTEAQTEELRVALQRYRDISEQLLRI
ncbi:hypothetical protein [Streptomyces sp. HB132]|uniref:hypothetical protein n=1 Tax=Streptomyces sp. HB132 TaxID=767388 RepID=UPI001961D552|nr:hypothetical protein [Streptomyces sp. HB132]MBM7439506.1 hypothetical protein [Streptomyces sp. HB132]